MKSFWKKHWKWLVPTLAAAAALIVAGFLYFLGFRITYDPTIITNWDAVSACAAWVGVFVSVAAVIASIVAVFYAIRVPKEIADRQDKIALFEKRYEVCQVFSRCVSFYERVVKAKTTKELQDACQFIFDDRHFDEIDRDYFLKKSLEFERKIHQTAMLFPKIDEHEVGLVYISLFDLLVVIVENKDSLKARNTFMTTFYNFNIKYGKIIWEETIISNVQ